MQPATFPRWLSVLTLILAAVALAGVIGAAISEPLGALMLLSSILLSVWLLAVGRYLLRGVDR